MKFKIQKFVFSCLWASYFLLPSLAFTQALDVEFTAEPQKGMTGQVFKFTNTTTNGTSPKWDFGDGGKESTGNEVHHIFSYPKTYAVKLSVTDSKGVVSEKAIEVTVTSPSSSQAAVLSASFVPARGNAEKDVVFANTSAGPANKWKWDFGDGKVEDPGGRSPTHTYDSFGDYIVTMIMEAPNGLTQFKTKKITVPVPPADGPANAREPVRKIEDCYNAGPGYSGDFPKWRMFDGEWTVGLAAQAQALKYDFATKKAGVNSGLGAGASFRFYEDVDFPGRGDKVPISQIRTECRMSTWKTQKEAWLPKATPLFSITPVIYASQLTSEDDLKVEPAIMFGVFDDIINIGTGFNLTGKDGEVGDVFLLLSIGAGFNW